MRCLCGSTSCRGTIGGTQEAAAAVLASADAGEDEYPDASNDPQPIMITEAAEDAAVSVILDRIVGLGRDRTWNAALQRRWKTASRLLFRLHSWGAWCTCCSDVT